MIRASYQIPHEFGAYSLVIFMSKSFFLEKTFSLYLSSIFKYLSPPFTFAFNIVRLVYLSVFIEYLTVFLPTCFSILPSCLSSLNICLSALFHIMTRSFFLSSFAFRARDITKTCGTFKSGRFLPFVTNRKTASFSWNIFFVTISSTTILNWFFRHLMGLKLKLSGWGWAGADASKSRETKRDLEFEFESSQHLSLVGSLKKTRPV